jgi:hypothetical protein
MRRILAAAVLVTAGLAAVPAHAVDVRKCVYDNNRIPEPGYGGVILDPVGTVTCIHPM